MIIILVLLLFVPILSGRAEEKNEEIFELEEIVITATRTKEKAKDVPANMNVVKATEKTPFDLGEEIKEISGIQLERYGDYGALSYIYLRGANSNQTLFLKDGRVLNNRATGTADISQLLLDNIERIEVKKGASSSLYGANALGGVFNIITKQNATKPETTISSGIGTIRNNELDRQNYFHVYRISHRNSFDKVDINISGSLERSEGHRINNDYNAYNFDGNIGYAISKTSTLKLFGGYYTANKGVPNSIQTPTTLTREKDEIAYTKIQFSSSVDEDNIIGSLYWNKDVFDYDSPDALFGAQHTNRNIWTIGSEWQYDKQISDHLVSFGFSGLVDSMAGTTEQGNFGNPQVNSASFFLQDQIHFSENIVANIAARYDFNSKFGSQWNPLAGLLIPLSSDFRFRTNFGTSFRAPTFNELFWPESAFEKGNPDLKPETAWSFDAGFEYQYKSIFTRLTFFYTAVSDLIEWAPATNNPFQWTPSNTDKANWKGAEVEFQTKLTEQISGLINYTYLFTKNEKTDTALRFRPLNKANIGIKYFSPWQQTITLNVQYQDIRYTNIANTSYLPSIWLANLRIIQKINELMDASLDIENLNDLSYEFQTGYPMPRRSVKGGITVKF